MPRPLKVGVQLPEVEYEARWTDLLAIARVAEDIGLDSIWYGDHLLYRRPGDRARGPWECWSILAALAASTSRITLGPLVACTSFHNPAMLAKKAATVDEISARRLILGLGAGWNETEYAAFGFPFDHRISRFEEAFTIIRTLLQDGAIDFDGRYYQMRDCELQPQARAGGPPLMIGSNGERMLAITAPHVAAWNSWFNGTGNSPGGVSALRDRVDAAAVAANRDPGSIDRTVAVLVALPGAKGRPSGNDGDAGPRPLSGGPEAIAAELRDYAAAGIGHVQLVLDPITAASVAALAPVLEALDAT